MKHVYNRFNHNMQRLRLDLLAVSLQKHCLPEDWRADCETGGEAGH